MSNSYQTYNDNQPIKPEDIPPTNAGLGNDGVYYAHTVTSTTHEPVAETGNILDTLRTPSGSLGNPDMASLRDRVTVRGMELEVATAIKMGYLSRDIDGRLKATGRTGQDAVRSPASSTPADSWRASDKGAENGFVVEHSPEDRNSLNYITSKVPRSAFVRAALEGLDNDTISRSTLQAIGEGLGQTLEEAEGTMRYLAEIYNRQGVEALKRLGIAAGHDQEVFMNWANSERSMEYRSALQRQIINGDLGGFASLGRDYWQNLHRINPDMILNVDFGPGVSVRKASGGEIVVKTPSGEVSWKTAVRMGLIALTPNGYAGGHKVGEMGAKGGYKPNNPNWFRGKR